MISDLSGLGKKAADDSSDLNLQSLARPSNLMEQDDTLFKDSRSLMAQSMISRPAAANDESWSNLLGDQTTLYH